MLQYVGHGGSGVFCDLSLFLLTGPFWATSRLLWHTRLPSFPLLPKTQCFESSQPLAIHQACHMYMLFASFCLICSSHLLLLERSAQCHLLWRQNNLLFPLCPYMLRALGYPASLELASLGYGHLFARLPPLPSLGAPRGPGPVLGIFAPTLPWVLVQCSELWCLKIIF